MTQSLVDQRYTPSTEEQRLMSLAGFVWNPPFWSKEGGPLLARMVGQSDSEWREELEEAVEEAERKSENTVTEVIKSRVVDDPGQLLQSLREQAQQLGAIGYHQLGAHLSLAYAAKAAPEAWELYQIPQLCQISVTAFYREHSREIQEALHPTLNESTLAAYAIERLSLRESLTPAERRHYDGGSSDILYYDAPSKKWARIINIPAICWFDSRKVFWKQLAQSVDERIRRFENSLEATRRKAAEWMDPMALSKLETEHAQRLAAYDGIYADEDNVRRLLAKLDRTADFAVAMHALLRGAENQVRTLYGVSPIGQRRPSKSG